MSDTQEYLAEQMRDPEFAEAFKAADIEVEHQRLQSAVVEACSIYCASVLDMEENGYPKDISANDWHYQHCTKQTAMVDAYKSLIAFEAEHGIGEK